MTLSALLSIGIAGLGGYFFLMSRYVELVSPLQQRRGLVWFVLGLGIVVAGFVSPPQWFGANYRFTANMFEFVLTTGVAPPFLWSSLPTPLVDQLAQPRSWLSYLVKPLPTFLGANALFLIWHLPFAFELASGNLQWWLVKETVFLAAGLWAWLPICGPLKLWSHHALGIRVLYLFFLSIPTTLLGALFTFATGLIYSGLSFAFELCAPASPQDQQLGGLVMWLGSAAMGLVVLTIVFFQWFQSSDAPRPADE